MAGTKRKPGNRLHLIRLDGEDLPIHDATLCLMADDDGRIAYYDGGRVIGLAFMLRNRARHGKEEAEKQGFKFRRIKHNGKSRTGT